MSGLLMGMVWNYHVTGNERDVLLAMADHAHDDGSSCYPSVPRLAWKIGISERTIQRIIAKMVAGEGRITWGGMEDAMRELVDFGYLVVNPDGHWVLT